MRHLDPPYSENRHHYTRIDSYSYSTEATHPPGHLLSKPIAPPSTNILGTPDTSIPAHLRNHPGSFFSSNRLRLVASSACKEPLLARSGDGLLGASLDELGFQGAADAGPVRVRGWLEDGGVR